MGLAASQGRLLLLTSRMTDLEYRAQQISQRKLVLANQQEVVAKDYNESLNNRVLKVKQHNADGDYWVKMSADSLQDVNCVLSYTSTGAQVPNADSLSAAEMEAGLRDGVFLIAAATFAADGTATIQKDNEGKNINVSWQESTNFADILDTTDDSQGQSKYEYEMAKVQRVDKQLDLELKNIETQHKAVETELDSVKKVIQKNIEISFKTFA